jgi:Phage integrase, N-terminal SAM-like domain
LFLKRKEDTEVEKQRRKRGEGCIYKVKGSLNWYIRYYRGKKYHFESTGSPEKKIAEEILRDRLAKKQLDQPPPGRATFEEMEDDIITDYKINGKKSLARIKLSLENLREYFSDTKASAITTTRMKKYISERQAEGAANASINRDLSCLRRMFNLAIQ